MTLVLALLILLFRSSWHAVAYPQLVLMQSTYLFMAHQTLAQELQYTMSFPVVSCSYSRSITHPMFSHFATASAALLRPVSPKQR